MNLLIQAEEEEDISLSEQLAVRLGVSAGRVGEELFSDLLSAAAMILHASTHNGLSLSAPQINKKARVSISFHSGALTHRRLYGGGKSQSIAKAIGITPGSRVRVVDATGGLGSDGFTLASLGAEVTCVERSPVLSVLLEDAMHRAIIFAEDAGDEDLLGVLRRFKVVEADSLSWLASASSVDAEVVYLDPMFPERKKSASVKKEMQVLQALLGKEPQQDERLLAAALARASHRVVVKRPRHAPPIKGPAPQYSIEGKTTRFDIYPLKSLKK